jgi:hypothetical protein
MMLEISQSGYFADLERLADQYERVFQFVDQDGRGVAALLPPHETSFLFDRIERYAKSGREAFRVSINIPIL